MHFTLNYIYLTSLVTRYFLDYNFSHPFDRIKTFFLINLRMTLHIENILLLLKMNTQINPWWINWKTLLTQSKIKNVCFFFGFFDTLKSWDSWFSQDSDSTNTIYHEQSYRWWWWWWCVTATVNAAVQNQLNLKHLQQWNTTCTWSEKQW